jgi:hypothetical protein
MTQILPPPPQAVISPRGHTDSLRGIYEKFTTAHMKGRMSIFFTQRRIRHSKVSMFFIRNNYFYSRKDLIL